MSEPEQDSAAQVSPNTIEATTEQHDTSKASSPQDTEAVEPTDPAGLINDGDGPQAQTALASSEDQPTRSRSTSTESGEASPTREATEKAGDSAPPLPSEAPPLPAEAPPAAEDDGWDFHWSEEAQAYYFYNRLTGATTWENPRLASDSTAAAQNRPAQPASTPAAQPPLPASDPEALPAGGYNPAIHGDYDPNAWYAQKPAISEAAGASSITSLGDDHAAMGSFNRFTGAWQTGGDDMQDRHNDENKSRRQMNAYFDVDAVANSHDGRSLKAERSGKKPSKAELKAFKEKRKARKEEKRRAWLRD